ncbi:MAG: hemolysin III family protein [Gammaproteobacteria bacterium]
MQEGERLNSLTHVIGAAAALAGLVVLVVFAARQGDPWKIVSFSVYGVSLLLVYLTSSFYHSLSGRAKAIFRRLDHAAIYLLIAGTYTPFTLVTLHGVWGWSVFGVVWGLAILGIALEHLPNKGHRILPVVIYVLMGWVGLVAIKPLLASLSFNGLLWLIIGGGFYTLGIVFYALDHKVRYFHAIWHLFVLAGSISHYCVILLYVL